MAVRSQQLQFSTNNVIVSFTSLGLTPGTVRYVTVQGVSPLAVPSGFYVNTPQTLSVINDAGQITNGYCVFTNQICGVPFNLTISTYYNVMATNFLVQAAAQPDTNGNVSAAQYVGTWNPYTFQFFWANPVLTNFNYAIQGGGVYWNTAATTNGASPAKIVWVYPTPPYNYTNHPYALTFTN